TGDGSRERKVARRLRAQGPKPVRGVREALEASVGLEQPIDDLCVEPAELSRAPALEPYSPVHVPQGVHADVVGTLVRDLADEAQLVQAGVTQAQCLDDLPLVAGEVEDVEVERPSVLPVQSEANLRAGGPPGPDLPKPAPARGPPVQRQRTGRRAD